MTASPVRRRLLATVIASLVGSALLAPVAAHADYYVYCANNRIEVDGRSPDQMRIARGSGVCQMGPKFGFLSDAQSFAQRNFGGAGRSCVNSWRATRNVSGHTEICLAPSVSPR